MLARRKEDGVKLCDKLLVDTIEMQTLLSCGRKAALEIGNNAKARVQIGKRVLWSVSKLEKYIKTIAE